MEQSSSHNADLTAERAYNIVKAIGDRPFNMTKKSDRDLYSDYAAVLRMGVEDPASARAFWDGMLNDDRYGRTKEARQLRVLSAVEDMNRIYKKFEVERMVEDRLGDINGNQVV